MSKLVVNEFVISVVLVGVACGKFKRVVNACG